MSTAKPKSEQSNEEENNNQGTSLARTSSGAATPPLASISQSLDNGSCSSTRLAYAFPDDNAQGPTTGYGQQQESAEEVLKASFDFKMSAHHDLSHHINHTNGYSRELYPSAYLASLADSFGEEKREESECLEAVASVNPDDFVSEYAFDDDPVTRKIMEEEMLMNRVRMRSMVMPNEFVEHAEEEDSKPPAQSVAFASAYQNDMFSDAASGVLAELVGESDFSPCQSSPGPPYALASDGFSTEEATVLDSKPAAMPSGWSHESTEATVLDDSAQNGDVWTTHNEECDFEEIAVTGRDEAEATVVEIAEEMHPADLELEYPGVEAELIGRDYSHGESLRVSLEQRAVLTEVASEYAVAVIGNNIAENAIPASFVAFPDESHPADNTISGGSASLVGDDFIHGESVFWAAADQHYADSASQAISRGAEHATIVEITEDVHPADLDVEGAQAEYIGRDLNQGDLLARRQTWTGSADDLVTAPRDDFAMVTATGIERDIDNIGNIDSEAVVVAISEDLTRLGTRAESEHATIVEITEDVHPADLNVAGVQAEFIGRDFNRGESFERSQTWTGPADHLVTYPQDDFTMVRATNVEGGSDNIRSIDSEAVVVAISDDLAGVGTRAESVVIGERSQSLTGTVQNAHALPMSTIASDRRSISTSNLTTTRCIIDPNPMNSAYPVKETPPPPPIPPRSDPRRARSQNSGESQFSTTDVSGNASAPGARIDNKASVTSSGDILSPLKWTSTSVLRHTNNVRGRLFGTDGNKSDFDLSNVAGSSLPRTLLPWSVFPSETTGMWVATVNTDQKALDNNDIAGASKALRAFSVPAREQAEALARAWTPPRMLPFNKNTKCFICDARFAVFKRACHCRNCGVCVCSGCVVQWPSKMIPDTYNIKQESIVNICKSCDFLCSAFRTALLDGNLDRAVAIHSTGNVNLVTPFGNIKGELFYPVHCAVLGGSLNLLQWLVDTHCCPLRSIRISGKTRQSSGSFTPILTSRGRSLLGIAIEKEKIDIVRYLVVDKGMPLIGEKDLSMGTLIRLLERILRLLPTPEERAELSSFSDSSALGNDSAITDFPPITPRQTRVGATPDTSSSRQSEESWRADEALAYELSEQSRRDQDSEGSVDDACIICFANSIDCVVTPCGHQICCMQCSSNISRCPVCGVDCCFIKVFRAN